MIRSDMTIAVLSRRLGRTAGAGFVLALLGVLAACGGKSLRSGETVRDRVLCDDSCEQADNGVCDDGIGEAQTSVCAPGADCTDCGERIASYSYSPYPSPSAQSAGAEGQSLCSDTCAYAGDGECDDGGPDSLYDVCEFGSDCADCGPRTAASEAAVETQQLCTDTCPYAGDGECDDGGPDSLYDLCELGSDCTDCGPRTSGGGSSAGPAGDLCMNTCEYANDGDCDDGGPGSDFDLCEYGSDCGDCGPRDPSQGATNGAMCNDTCQYAGDGECDDGGPNSLYDLCELGSDCTDCGPRDGGASSRTSNFCTDTCEYANDGDCDDGGPGSDFDLCALGTDCGDCGPRDLGTDATDPGVVEDLCTNGCRFANDGECDDGGEGSMSSLCPIGTDCDDCGTRQAVPQTTVVPPSGSGTLCTNTCAYADDGECDDGGEGSLNALCEFGSDCADCGVRLY